MEIALTHGRVVIDQEDASPVAMSVEVQ